MLKNDIYHIEYWFGIFNISPNLRNARLSIL
jgi:hypothetical protein